VIPGKNPFLYTILVVIGLNPFLYTILVVIGFRKNLIIEFQKSDLSFQPFKFLLKRFHAKNQPL